MAAAYEAGFSISLEGLFAGESRRRISLPDYPSSAAATGSKGTDAAVRTRAVTLLGARHESPRGEVLFETEVTATDPAWLDDHRVQGEAIGEIVLSRSVDRSGIKAHPTVLDGCFRIMSAARNQAGSEDRQTYLPFGWERLWLTERLPGRLICHSRMRNRNQDSVSDAGTSDTPKVLTGDLRFFTPEDVEIGGLDSHTVKCATRDALLSSTEEVEDLLYEVIWRDRELAPGMPPADFLASPSAIAAHAKSFAQYLAAARVWEPKTGTPC